MAGEKDVQATDAALSQFERLFLVTSLHDIVVKLTLTKHVINQKRSIEDVQEKLLAKRYVRDEERLQNFAKLEEQLRLENKRKEIVEVMQVVTEELKNSGSFTRLVLYNNEEEERWNDQESIFSTEKKLREDVCELKKKLNSLSEAARKEVQDKDEEIVRLKIKIQALRREFKVSEPKLIEENRAALKDVKEKGLENYAQLQSHYESLQTILEEEKLSHEEVKTHLEKCDQNLSEKAKFWMEKLKKDTEDTAREIADTKGTLAQVKLKKTQLSEKVEELEKALEAENLIKEKKRQQQLEQQQELSIVKIQRWWRQILALRHAKTCKKKHKKQKNGRR